jgi:hypothetical protein
MSGMVASKGYCLLLRLSRRTDLSDHQVVLSHSPIRPLQFIEQIIDNLLSNP